jgi:DNA-binding beta-propeller fold protein YncE
VYCGPNGEVYVADTRNHAVRKIDASGIITTVAGNGVKGFSPNATPATEAMMNQPFGVFFDAATNTLYIADTYNSQVKKVIMPE